MNLKEKRIEAGLTQAELAEKVGVNQPQICKIERGESRPDVLTAKRIAKVLNIDWTEFFNDDPEEKGA